MSNPQHIVWLLHNPRPDNFLNTLCKSINIFLRKTKWTNTYKYFWWNCVAILGTGAKISQFYNTRTNPAGATRFICSIESTERIYQTSVALKSPSGETYLSSTESRLTGSGTTLYPQNFFFDLTHSIDGIYHCLLSDKRIASASILYYGEIFCQKKIILMKVICEVFVWLVQSSTFSKINWVTLQFPLI